MSVSSLASVNMVKSQILTGNVLAEDVIAALQATPREAFVPQGNQGVAYVDAEVPLGNGRYLLEPLVFARMLEEAALTKDKTVLVVGCGSGYSAAVLAHLAKQVVALEEEPSLAAKAKTALAGCSNVMLVQGALVEGVSQYAPYDVIMIEGGIEYVPQALSDQLKEGGALIACEAVAKPHTGTSGLGQLVHYTKIQSVLYRTPVCNVNVAPLAVFAKPATFVF